MKNKDITEQLSLFSIDGVADASEDDETDKRIELVSFRELVPEIKDTGYLTHAIFYYPAKFIPHVVRYALKSFTKKVIGSLIRSQVRELLVSRLMYVNGMRFYST